MCKEINNLSRKTTNQYLEQWGFPKKFIKKHWSDVIPAFQEVRKLLEDYATKYPETNRGLFLVSNTKGRGKTFFLTLLCHELLQQKKIKTKITFVNALALETEFRRCYDPDSSLRESEILESLRRSEIVVIDDLAARNPKEWIVVKFYEIINQIYEDERTLFLASNHDLEELETQWNSVGDENMGSRIVDRLYEMVDILDLGEGRSYRREVPWEKNKD